MLARNPSKTPLFSLLGPTMFKRVLDNVNRNKNLLPFMLEFILSRDKKIADICDPIGIASSLI